MMGGGNLSLCEATVTSRGWMLPYHFMIQACLISTADQVSLWMGDLKEKSGTTRNTHCGSSVNGTLPLESVGNQCRFVVITGQHCPL